MSQTIDVDTRVRISPSVYARAFGAELVLLHFGRGEYFGLDEIGALVWRGLERGDSLGMIADIVVTQFDVSHEQAVRDVLALVTELQKETLLEV